MQQQLQQLCERVDWILAQRPYHRLLHTWQIGECLNEVGAMEERELLFRLSTWITARHPLKCNASLLRQMCRVHAAFPKGVDLRLSWTHYCILARVPEVERREFYEEAAAQASWTIAQLTRQIRSNFYSRSRKLPLKQDYAFDFLRSLSPSFSEQELERALLTQLPYFLLELGYGFSLVARQQVIRTASGQTLFVDWVFYHFLHRCFVLIDLKVQSLKHAHIGQMDTYVRLFDQYWKQPSDAPTLGLLLCPDWDTALLHHSVLAENVQLWVGRYRI